jgi:5-methylcytosine-specific restriction endonuclease McrA
VLKHPIQKIFSKMPIKPENKKRYPANWKQIRADILERAENRCEFCGILNYTIRENGSKVVLTIAHLDHTPEHCEYSNLRALCQKCHNSYDAPHRAETRRTNVNHKSKNN